MNYYVAPMEGLTDRVWRQAHQKWFGWAGGPARYYAPFLSPPENRVLIKKKMAELAPEANPGVQIRSVKEAHGTIHEQHITMVSLFHLGYIPQNSWIFHPQCIQ